ncbi:cation:proton antiporter, partial [Staphylococcus aureus]
QGALQNGNYIGLTLMIITSLIAMYSLFRILFYMYFGDKDGEEVHFKRIPQYRKGILSILVVVVIAIGIAAPVLLKITNDATELNTNDQLYQKLVNPHLKGEE